MTKLTKSKVYLASPLFTPSQIATLEKVEKSLAAAGINFFSPRLDGGDLSQMTPEERAAAARRIFESNVRELDECDIYLICIDDRDVGTAWEFGYGYALQQADRAGAFQALEPGINDKVLVTYSSNGYGLNIMLNDSSEMHFPTTDGMLNAIRAWASDNIFEYERPESRATFRACVGAFATNLKANSDVH